MVECNPGVRCPCNPDQAQNAEDEDEDEVICGSCRGSCSDCSDSSVVTVTESKAGGDSKDIFGKECKCNPDDDFFDKDCKDEEKSVSVECCSQVRCTCNLDEGMVNEETQSALLYLQKFSEEAGDTL